MIGKSDGWYRRSLVGDSHGPSSGRMCCTSTSQIQKIERPSTHIYCICIQSERDGIFVASLFSFTVSAYPLLQYQIPHTQPDASITPSTSVTCLDNNTKPTIKNSLLPQPHALQTQHPLPDSRYQQYSKHNVFGHPRPTTHSRSLRPPG